MARLEGWESRLADHFLKHKDTPFEWGSHDCATFMFGAVREVTGQEMRPVTWTTAMEAARVIEEAGSLGAAACEPLGRPSQNWRELRRGDVAVIDNRKRQALCVCTGQTLCGPGPSGLEHFPLSAALHIWRVG